MYLLALIAFPMMVRARFPVRDSRGKWPSWEPAKVEVLVILIDSTIFVFATSLIMFGVWENGQVETCRAIFWFGIMSYAMTKVVMMVFLVERVHIVHGNMKRRRESKLYFLNLFLSSGWIAAILVVVIYNQSGIQEPDGACIIAAPEYACSFLTRTHGRSRIKQNFERHRGSPYSERCEHRRPRPANDSPLEVPRFWMLEFGEASSTRPYFRSVEVRSSIQDWVLLRREMGIPRTREDGAGAAATRLDTASPRRIVGNIATKVGYVFDER